MTTSPVSDVIGGVPIEDPYRWLENDNDAAVLAWQDDQDTRTVRALTSSPHAARVRSAVEATFEDVYAYTAPRRYGASWFRTTKAPGQASAVLEVAAAPAEAGRVLVDPADEDPDSTLLVWQPAPDGTKVVVGTGTDAMAMTVRVLDAANGEVLLNGIPHPGTYFFAWVPDGSGFYYQATAAGTDRYGNPVPETQIWWQALDGSQPLRQDVSLRHPIAWPTVSADGKWAAVLVDQTSPRPQWVRRVGGQWQRFLPDAAAMYKGSFVGDEFWAISDDTSGWCRLVAIPVDTADDAATWRELVPGREGTKLAAVTPCGSKIALVSVREGAATLTVLDRDGNVDGDVALPAQGAIGTSGLGHVLSIMGDVVCPDVDGCTFVFSSLDRSPGSYRADLLTRELTAIVPPAHILPERAIDVCSTEGPQGAISYRVMRRETTRLDGSAPVIVTGYGGFNVPWLPCYSAMAAAWTELGGVWVHCHLRGGGEYDDEFWKSGRMHRKQGSFDDLYAVLEELAARGTAIAERTGLWGSSNGGLLVGASVTQRPDLFRAGVAQVPILDLLQCRKDPHVLGICMADYGNPDDPADAPVMHAYSPYHQIRSGTVYPAVLFDSGTNDSSCPAWHSRKTAARLLDATGSDNRVLLRTRAGSGHSQMTTTKLLERDIEELTFLADELGTSA